VNIDELKAQVSALQIQPGTVVVLRLGSDTPVSVARTMGEELRKLVPFGNLILVLPNGESIEALDEAQMRELGWVRANSAVQDVVAERQRQIASEGYSTESDDNYIDGDLAAAAGSYALHAHDVDKAKLGFAPAWWPWTRDSWKPTTPRNDLVKAGALILAEIERIDRSADKGGAE
jgi:hypothetical protein